MRRIAIFLVVLTCVAGGVTVAQATGWGGGWDDHHGTSYVQYKKKKLCDLIRWIFEHHHSYSTQSKVKSSYGWYTIGWLIKFCFEGDEDCDPKSWSSHQTFYGTKTYGGNENEGCQAPPDAYCKATTNDPVTGQEVTWSAAGSKDPDGTIVKYEWDTDGDGYDDGNDQTVKKTYTTSGLKYVKLRVTDNDGATDTSHCYTYVKTNTPPKPYCKYSPYTIYKYKTAYFDGSSSTDSDGAIAKWQWDLDGNGSYETTTNGPSTTKSFSSTGSKTVRLKVTDNAGASASTTLTVPVK